MDNIAKELRFLQRYLKEADTLIHAGAETRETVVSLFLAVEKLTEITAALAEKVVPE